LLVEKLKNKKSKAKDLYICNCKKIKTTPMLCKDKITSFSCIIDDILKEINHSEDIRRKVSDSEIVTTAFIAATNFYRNYRSAIKFVKQYNLFPNMLEESRFNTANQHNTVAI